MSKLYLQLQDINTPSAGTGIFESVFEPNYPVEYKQIFGDILSKSLDIYINAMWGQRLLLQTIDADTWKSVVDSAISLNVKEWVKQAEILALTYDALAPTKSETTETRTGTDTNNSTGSDTQCNKPFNETELKEYERNNNTNTNTKQSDESVTRIVKGTTSSASTAKTLSEELQWRRTNLKNRITGELVDIITLQVY